MKEEIQKMSDYEKFWNEQMKNPEFRDEWIRTEPEYQIARALIKARVDRELTQKDLSKLTGITQADISRLETGSANPSLNTLRRLAQGLGLRMNISFEKNTYANETYKNMVVADSS